MFNLTRFVGPSETWGPIHLLRELDRLLLLAGWLRKGVDPNTVQDPLFKSSAANTGDNPDYTFGPFGYKHPLLSEHIWFKASLCWYWNTASNDYEANLSIGALPIGEWNAAYPPIAYAFSCSYRETGMANRTAEWHIAAGDSGFYLLQTQGVYPGGFCIERHASGVWLMQHVDAQWRFGKADNLNLQTLKGNWNTWHTNEAVDGGVFEVTSQGTKFLGLASYLSLEFSNWGNNGTAEDNAGGAGMTPDGVLLRGPWIHLNGRYPVLSEYVRRYFPPMGLVQAVESGTVKTYSRITSTGAVGQIYWRKQ